MFCLVILIVFSPVIFLTLFVTKTRGLSRRGKLLYLATLILELPGVGARFVVSAFLAPFILMPIWVVFCFIFAALALLAVFASRGGTTIQQAIAVTLAGVGGIFTVLALLLLAVVVISVSWGPLIWSWLNLIGLRGGAFYTPWAMGARKPSEREREAYSQALTLIQANTQQALLAPTSWFVLDKLELEAFTIGTTVYLTRQLLKPHHGSDLIALLSHELGHTNSIDGRLVLALRRLVIPPMYLLSYAVGQAAPGMVSLACATASAGNYAAAITTWVLNALLAAGGGGLGIQLLFPLWIGYFRQREYEADDFAAHIGFAHPLIDHLEKNEHFDFAVPYLMSPQPYIELRIDRLLSFVKHQSP